MSLTAFKRKSVINYGSKRSGSAPGGVWLPQGPFGHSTNGLQLAIHNPGPVGFSINGGHRNVGGVGRDMKMSKSGTPYRGTQPIGFGGTYGQYPSATLVGSSSNGIQSTGAVPNAHSKAPVVQPVLNSRIVDTMGSQYIYIKPSVLSTYGMLRQKYRWAYNGKYPNYWVQPIYTGNQTETASQGLYIQTIAAANDCVVDVNDFKKYVGYIKNCGPTDCSTTTAKYKYNTMAANAPYTKFLRNSQDSSQYTLQIQRQCANPTGLQKPFPFATNTGTGIAYTGGLKVSAGNSGACAIAASPVYLAPPEWYIKSNSQFVES